jgi:hypothetical protein
MSISGVAHDPSAPDYGGTSPRHAQGGKGQMRLPYPLGREEKEGYAFLLTVLRSSWVCSRSS